MSRISAANYKANPHNYGNCLYCNEIATKHTLNANNGMHKKCYEKQSKVINITASSNNTFINSLIIYDTKTIQKFDSFYYNSTNVNYIGCPLIKPKNINIKIALDELYRISRCKHAFISNWCFAAINYIIYRDESNITTVLYKINGKNEVNMITTLISVASPATLSEIVTTKLDCYNWQEKTLFNAAYDKLLNTFATESFVELFGHTLGTDLVNIVNGYVGLFK